jgi:predicted nucleotidyltransferase
MLKPQGTAQTKPGPLTPRQRYARLKARERRALQDYRDRLRARFANRVAHLILYGSRARMEGDRESDLDVLVVIDRDDRQVENEVALEAFAPSLEHDVLISPLVWSQAHYDLHRRLGLLIFQNIERDGIELWNWQTSAPSSNTASTPQETS